MKHLHALVFISFALSWSTGHAQTVPLKFQVLSLADGLPHSIVNHAMQDSQGFMWYSTHGGLSRYDGYTFKTFTPQNDPRVGLLHYEVEAAQEDARQNIWIRYSAGGVSRYNMATQQLSHYPLQEGLGSISGDFAVKLNRENIMFVNRQSAYGSAPTGGYAAMIKPPMALSLTHTVRTTLPLWQEITLTTCCKMLRTNSGRQPMAV